MFFFSHLGIWWLATNHSHVLVHSPKTQNRPANISKPDLLPSSSSKKYALPAMKGRKPHTYAGMISTCYPVGLAKIFTKLLRFTNLEKPEHKRESHGIHYLLAWLASSDIIIWSDSCFHCCPQIFSAWVVPQIALVLKILACVLLLALVSQWMKIMRNGEKWSWQLNWGSCLVTFKATLQKYKSLKADSFGIEFPQVFVVSQPTRRNT